MATPLPPWCGNSATSLTWQLHRLPNMATPLTCELERKGSFLISVICFEAPCCSRSETECSMSSSS
eukprot:1435720-Prymnesium_polylepis.1